MSPQVLMAAAENFKRSYTSLRVRSLSSTYNCMGQVFACRRTSVEPRHFDDIVSDDGYRRLLDNEKPLEGDVAVYRGDTGAVAHVAIVVDVRHNLAEATFDVTVLSQWGHLGEYFHDLRDYPVLWEAECGRISIHIWTERARSS